MEAVATLPKFKAWHMKHQAACSWLTHACVATLQPVFAFLDNIKSNFDHDEFLKSGESLPCDKHEKLMHLMNELIKKLQIGMVINSIAHYGQAPQSCRYLQRSIEGISPQQTPPHSRQRNNDNQYQNRQ